MVKYPSKEVIVLAFGHRGPERSAFIDLFDVEKRSKFLHAATYVFNKDYSKAVKFQKEPKPAANVPIPKDYSKAGKEPKPAANEPVPYNSLFSKIWRVVMTKTTDNQEYTLKVVDCSHFVPKVLPYVAKCQIHKGSFNCILIVIDVRTQNYIEVYQEYQVLLQKYFNLNHYEKIAFVFVGMTSEHWGFLTQLKTIAKSTTFGLQSFFFGDQTYFPHMIQYIESQEKITLTSQEKKHESSQFNKPETWYKPEEPKVEEQKPGTINQIIAYLAVMLLIPASIVYWLYSTSNDTLPLFYDLWSLILIVFDYCYLTAIVIIFIICIVYFTLPILITKLREWCD